MVGLRVLSEQQKGNHRSASKSNAAHLHLTHCESGSLRPSTWNSTTAGGSILRTFGYGSTERASVHGGNYQVEVEGTDYEEEDLVPSALHKYSAEMRDSKFCYIDENEAVVPHFNLNFI